MFIDKKSASTARGSNQGFVVMAEGEDINESIGGEISTIEGTLEFLKSFTNNQEALAEYMPDSDYSKVTRLYID